jgi:uncharacterized protein YaiL (DUF2058 family)
MSMSLREQLLAAGLGTKKQAKEADRHDHQQLKNKAAKEARQAEQEKRAAEARAAKAARDQELNRKRQENAERKERWAQIKQLIEQHRIPKPESGEYFNFIDREKVRRFPVDSALRERIMRGEVIIVRCEGRYDAVPPEIGERIREREPRAVVSLQAKQPSSAPPDESDPYKDYVVPDDLMW